MAQTVLTIFAGGFLIALGALGWSGSYACWNEDQHPSTASKVLFVAGVVALALGAFLVRIA